MDTHMAEQRHKNMQAVRCKDTKIEVLLRKELWSRGIRYRKNVKDVFGKPDIVFKGKKVAVFCDSEFWHGYNWDVKQNDIKSHRDFWIPKIERNIERDKEVNAALDGNVISKELLIKTLSGFISSTIEDKCHNVGIVLHTGSICFDAILLAYAAISNILYNETNAADLIHSLRAGDVVLCYNGSRGKAKPSKWVFEGFVNSIEETPREIPGTYVVLQNEKKGRNYLPERSWTKIVPYYGTSKSMDGRGLRQEDGKRYDFFKSVLEIQDTEIPRTIDTSTVIVMSREEANTLVGSLSFRFGKTDIKLTDLVPVSYYTESNQEYQYGINPSKNEPVIKLTGKVSVARKLLLSRDGNRHIGLIVLGEDLY